MHQRHELALQSRRRARDRIGQSYERQLRVAVLAAGAGYPTTRFIRAIRSSYGETPGRDHLRRRMERASELLRSAKLTVTEVCLLVGVSSLGSFSAQFTRVLGPSPTEYRRQAAHRGGPAPIPGCFALMWQSGLPREAAAAAREFSDGGRQFESSAPRSRRPIVTRHPPPDPGGVAMITGISIVSVWVLDQDSAKQFYSEQLGCEVTNDIQLENGMRWLTVRPPGSTGQELLLLDPSHSMLDPETAQQVRTLVAKGALSPGVMATTDCRGDHAELTSRGVQFNQPPADRPYGVEAVLRDDSGNWYSFTERQG